MGNAVLLMTNKVIRLKGKGYEILSPQYTIFGKLKSFKIGQIDYIFKGPFLVKGKYKVGYCKLSVLDQYRNEQIKFEEFVKAENWVDDTFELAIIGDMFEITKVDFYNAAGQRDFVNYYNQFSYRFKITRSVHKINFSNSSEYPPVDNNSNSANYSEKTHIFLNYNETFDGKFYKKNFGDKVPSLIASSISDIYIEQKAMYMIYICIQMYWIMEENLLGILAINSLEDIYIAMVDQYVNYAGDEANPNNSYNDLTIVDKMTGELLRGWGQYSNTTDSIVAFLPKVYFPVVDISVLSNFNNSMVTFYSKLTRIKETTLFKYDSNNNPLNEAGVALTTDPLLRDEKDSDRRIIVMISLLPSIGFSIFSVQDRLKLLDKVLDYSEIYEDRPKVRSSADVLIEISSGVISPLASMAYEFMLSEDNSLFIEEDIIKLVASFNTTYDEANALLNFLLETKSFDEGSSITKYERLYNLINDKGADNIAIVNWFVSEENNRARLILILYEIWQKSKYYFYSQPPGVIMNPNGTNPQNYFLFTTEGNAYCAKYDNDGEVIPGTGSEPLLEFQSVDLILGYKYLIKYIPDRIEKEKIIVNKKLILENYVSDYIPDAIELGHQLPEVYFGSYHLYQTISLVGFNLDEDIAAQAPQINLGLIPAFLFHYVEEFDRLKNVYAGISLVIEIALDVGLFFATSGASSAYALSHLRYLTKLGKVVDLVGTLEAGVAASEVLMAFRVGEGAAEIVSMTAGVTSSYLNYLGTVNDDPFKRRLSLFFTAFALASAGGAIYSNRKIVKMADEILTKSPANLITHLQNHAADVYDLLLQVAGKKATSLAEFASSIDNLPIVKDYYNNVLIGALADLKPKFFEDFGSLGGNVINKLNNAQVLSNWKKLADLSSADRKVFDIITHSERTLTLEKFYFHSPLRTNVEILAIDNKISFIDSFKNPAQDMIDKFLEKPEAINRWLTAPAQTRAIAKDNPELWLHVVDDLPMGTNFSKVKSSTNWQLIDSNGFVHFRASLTGPPPPVNFEGYIKFKKLSYAQQNVRRIQAETTFTNNAIATNNAYTTPITFQGQVIPRSRNGVGVSPTFKNLDMAFQPSPAVNLLGNGQQVVGLSESLPSITQKIKNFKGEVKVPVSGRRNLTRVDFDNAWLKMGINPADGRKLETKLKLVWHHVDDLDESMNCTMQLVRESAHRATCPHSGSVKLAEIFFNLFNTL